MTDAMTYSSLAVKLPIESLLPSLSPTIAANNGISTSLRIASKASSAIVVIPTYNEADNIVGIIHAIKRLSEPIDILVVDDNSPDGTAGLVREVMKEQEGVYLLQRAGKQGLGTAYRAGFAFALQHGWDYICQMDADFSHSPDDLLSLIDRCRQGADIALGSRYVRGGSIKGWPRRRWLLSRAANCYAQLMVGSRIKDLTGGFKCFKRNALEKIDLDKVTSEGYIFQVEMNYRAQRVGLNIEQCPICFTDRKQGKSKMGWNEARDGIQQVVKVRVRH